jgi:threonine/homoserine efflux transporter RhtA
LASVNSEPSAGADPSAGRQPVALAGRAVARLPPTSYFLTSAVFHYLGPSLAMLLFVHVNVLGVAWLRIASAAVVFALWRRPWRVLRTLTVPGRTPVGLADAVPAFTHPLWLLWGIGVGVCSSVIPYVTDQLAMARLPRATFALMLALLPAAATVIGLVILGQVPTARDLLGIGLVIAGVALHGSPGGHRGSGPAAAPARHNRGTHRRAHAVAGRAAAWHAGGGRPARR